MLAQERLGQLGVSTALGEEVARLVRLTGTHRPEAEDANGCVLCDADLALLGAGITRYGQYAQAIRQEYAWIPPEQFRAGRAQVLQAFLRRARIYQTDLLYQRLEEQARRNLQAELAQLAQEG